MTSLRIRGGGSQIALFIVLLRVGEVRAITLHVEVWNSRLSSDMTLVRFLGSRATPFWIFDTAIYGRGIFDRPQGEPAGPREKKGGREKKRGRRREEEVILWGYFCLGITSNTFLCHDVHVPTHEKLLNNWKGGNEGVWHGLDHAIIYFGSMFHPFFERDCIADMAIQ